MDDKRVADYFVVTGLDWSKQPLMPLEEVYPIEAKAPAGLHQDPMVELAVINRTMGETIPEGFKCIEFTPSGFPADLNHGSIRAPEMFLCYRRGRDIPPIVDVGVLYEGKDTKERLLPGCEIIYLTPQGRSANVNNSSGTKIFITFRRAIPVAPCDTLVVTEICIILFNKGEVAPHAHCMIRKTLNKGMMGSEVYLCYKKSMVKVNCLTYKPSILSRYPIDDLPNLPLPQQVSMFCLPMGATLESWSPRKLPPTPVFSTFILTTGTEKVYGAAVVFQEPLPEDKVALLDEEQKCVLGMIQPTSNEGAFATNRNLEIDQRDSLVVHQNKSICLLSRSPFFDTFKKFLFYIYRLVFSKVDDYSLQIPLERHISHFLSKIPMPCIQRPRIMIQLSSTVIILTQPDETPLPKSGASFVDVLKNLGPTNCVLLLLSTLMEHKILIHSLRPAVLTGVAEAIASMIFPLHWQCPYIPLCPLSLSYVLHSPTPFIVGIDSRYFDTFELPTDVTCVDLDTNTLTISEDRRSHTIKILPKRPAKLLKSSLEKSYEHLLESPEILTPTLPRDGVPGATLDDSYFNAELAVNKKKMQLELSIREAYLRFMASILKGFNQFLLPITNAPTDGAMDLNSLFDILGFVKSRDKAYNKFYALLMKTQMFSRFIEERSFVSDKDSSLAFFDYCLERVDETQEGPQRLIEIDETLLSSERTVLIMGPEPDIPDQPPISYPGYFPELDPSKFHESCGSPLPTSSHTSHSESKPSEQRQNHQSGFVQHIGSKGAAYNSPMVCRTQHEVKQSQKIASKHANVPNMWARFLAWHCYSLWFIHLSSYAKRVHSKSKVLRSAYDVLVTMQSAKLQPPDEVCYRVLMQLCGIYHLPVLAVKVLFEMKRRGIQPNAITYGFYNKAVLESKWPLSHATADQLWAKLRNVIMAVAHFKRGSSYYFPSHCTPISGPNLPFDGGHSRPSLPHSNSESDPDRQSMDSYLDSVSVEASSIAMTTVSRGHSTYIVSSIHSSAQKTACKPTGQDSEKLSDAYSLGNSLSHNENKSDSEDKNNCNNDLRDSFDQKSPGNSKLNSQSDSGSRQRAKSTSEVGGDINLIGAVKHKSRESISAGGLSDRGYGSLSMEESKDTTIFSSNALSPRTKSKDIHKSAEVTTHGFSDEVMTSTIETEVENKSPEKMVPGSIESLPSISLECQTPSRPTISTSSVRIPVTQNDPLGLFNPPAVPLQVASTNATTEPASTDQQGARSSNSTNLLLFSSPAFRHDNNETAPSPSRTVELPAQDRDVSQQNRDTSMPTSSNKHPTKTPTWVAMAAENVVGGGSELLGSALKMVTNKISRYRDVISNSGGRPSTSSSVTGHRAESLGSLTSVESSSDGSYAYGGQPSFAQSSFLERKQSEVIQVHDSESGVDVCLPPHPKRSSVTFQEVNTPNRGQNASRIKNSPFVSNLWSGLKTLQKSETFKGLASGLSQMGTSVKATMKETLTSDVWSLSNGMGLGAMANVGADFYGGSIPDSINEEEESRAEGNDAEDDDNNLNKRFPPLHLEDPTCPYMSTIRVDHPRPQDDQGPPLDPGQELNPQRAQCNPGSLSSIPSVAGAAPLNPLLYPVQVEMSTLNKCTRCLNLLYDEEIMAGWTADDSNLNTSCQFCTSQIVPFINIYIKDYRPFLKPKFPSNLSQSSESILSCHSIPQQQAYDQEQATLGTFELSPTQNTVASVDTTPSALSPGSHQSLQMLESEHKTNDKIVSIDKVSEETTIESCKHLVKEDLQLNEDDRIISEPSPSSGDGSNTRRCASISSLLGTTKDAKASSSRKSGSMDALNDSRKHISSSIVGSVEVAEPLSKSENEISSTENDFSVKNFVELDPLCYPYLSPLVLRKEVENLLVQESDTCFDGDLLIDEHPILFWNLIWYFKRLNVQSHLQSFIATSMSLNQHLQKCDLVGRCQHTQLAGNQSKHLVSIRTMWDNVRLHTDHGPPMYVLWNQGILASDDMFSKAMMETIVDCVMKNDVSNPLRLILSERARHLISIQSADHPRHTYTSFHSIYRDILFLSFIALGRENIDVDAFDKEFKNVLSDLTPYDSARLRVADRVPRSAAIYCRKMFKDLDI